MLRLATSASFVIALLLAAPPSLLAATLQRLPVTTYRTATTTTATASTSTTSTTSTRTTFSSPTRTFFSRTPAPTPRPDLVARSLRVVPTSRTATIEVTNDGSASAATSVARVVLRPTDDPQKGLVVGAARVPALAAGAVHSATIPLAIPAALPGRLFASELEVDVAGEVVQTATSEAIVNDRRPGSLVSVGQLGAKTMSDDLAGSPAWTYGPVYGELAAGSHEIATTWSIDLADIVTALGIPSGVDGGGLGVPGLLAASQLAEAAGAGDLVRDASFWAAVPQTGSRLAGFDRELSAALRDAFGVPVEAFPNADAFELSQRGALLDALGLTGDGERWLDLARSEGRAPASPSAERFVYDETHARMSPSAAARLYDGHKLGTAKVALTSAPQGSLGFVQVSHLSKQIVLSSGKTDALYSETVWADLGQRAQASGGGTPGEAAAVWGARSFLEIPEGVPTPGTAKGVYQLAGEYMAAGLDLTSPRTWTDPAGSYAEQHGAPAGLFGPGDPLSAATKTFEKIQFGGRDDMNNTAPEDVWRQAADPDNSLMDLLGMWGTLGDDNGGRGSGTLGDMPGATGGTGGGSGSGMPGGDLPGGGFDGTNDPTNSSGTGGNDGGAGNDGPTGASPDGATGSSSETSPTPSDAPGSDGTPTGDETPNGGDASGGGEVPGPSHTMTFETSADGSEITVTERVSDGEGNVQTASATFTDANGDGVFTTTNENGQEIALNPGGSAIPPDGTHDVSSTDGDTNEIEDSSSDDSNGDDSGGDDSGDEDSGDDDDSGDDGGSDGSEGGSDDTGGSDGEDASTTTPCAVDAPCDDVSVDHGLIDLLLGLPGVWTGGGERPDPRDRIILTTETDEGSSEFRLPPPSGVVDPVDDPLLAEGQGSRDPGDLPPSGVVDPVDPDGAGALNGHQVGSNPGAPMGESEPWVCPWELRTSVTGEIYYICPLRNDPATGLPTGWHFQAPESAPGTGEPTTSDTTKNE